MAITVREPELEELAEGAELLRTSLGFRERDAVPAWLMHATAEAGGLTLGAYAPDGDLVGWSFAVPGRCEGREELVSCGLAVRRGHRSAGIGRALKQAQRRVALERGIERIRWTADPLAAPALRLYLGGLGAAVVGYRAALYDAIRSAGDVPQDDVDVVWELRGVPGGSAREPRRLELPFRRDALGPAAHLAWRLEVREQLTEALALGWIGTDVELDRRARRSWLLLTERAR